MWLLLHAEFLENGRCYSCKQSCAIVLTVPFIRVYDLGYGYGKTNHDRNFKARTVGFGDSREGWNRMLAANNLANSQRRNKGLQV